MTKHLSLLLVVQATLTTLVFCTPLQSIKVSSDSTKIPLPLGAVNDFKDCTAAGVNCTCQEWVSSYPNWDITDFVFRYNWSIMSAATIDSPVPHGFVSFVVNNRALSYITLCKADSDKPDNFFYGDEWYRCDQKADGVRDEDADITWVRYDKTEDSIEVMQTWHCNDYSYKAIGNSTIPVECKTTYWDNPAWTEGETYSSSTTECLSRDGSVRIPWRTIMGD